MIKSRLKLQVLNRAKKIKYVPIWWKESMRFLVWKKPFVLTLTFVLVSAYSFSAIAEILKMPDIVEVPELERETLLRDLDIPSVRDRDPDPEAGPRLSVSEFRLQGIVEFPELGITRAELSKLVEGIRFDMMAEDKLLESGYTLEELGEVSDLLAEIETDTKGRHVGPLEVQKLVWLVRDQLLKRGITLGMIETVADKITQYYRERGFILAKAYIPEQRVRDGVVTLTLLLGVLGEVAVNENELYSDNAISYVFDDMMTKPVTSRVIEEKLFLINDFPGMAVQGFFEPGSQVGDSKLNVNVKSQRWFDANVRVDNHGPKDTGQNRFYGEFYWNNPIGIADQLQVNLLYATNPDNSVYGQVRYSGNAFSPRFRFALGAANNDFVLGRGNSESLNLLGLEGDTNIADFTLSYKAKRTRKRNYSFDLVYENVESIIKLTALPRDGGGVLDDEIRNYKLVFNYDILQEASRTLHQGNVKLISGEFLLGAEPGQDETFSILTADYSLLTFWKIPFTEVETRAIIRSSIQAASSPLSSISQFSLGGPTRTRAFAVNEFSADDVFYLGADWLFNSPKFLDIKVGKSNWREIMQPFLFIDASYGRVKSLVENEDDLTGVLVDAGFGLQFSYLNRLRGNIQFAYPLKSDFSEEPSAEEGEETEDESRVIFELQYSF